MLLSVFQTGGFMKSFQVLAVGTASAFASGTSLAQHTTMMDEGGMWGAGWMGGYGGYWGPTLLVVVVAALVWVVMRNRK
jgi:hypothetical protein